jgi:1-acyl-sn-glycerol-3-phosphate acyltransferase
VVRRGFVLWSAVNVLKPAMNAMTRKDWRGMEHVPATGGLIFAVNHISDFDPLVVSHFVYNAGRNPQFMAKDSLFRVPGLGAVMRATHQVPVHRGRIDAARSLGTAAEALRAGASIIVYPEGTTTKQPEHWPSPGKTGLARLWLDTGVPVVPIAQWGAQRIFDPITRTWRIRPRTPVVVEAGPPMDLDRWAGAKPTHEVLEEITGAVMDRLRDMLAGIRGEAAPDPNDSPTDER